MSMEICFWNTSDATSQEACDEVKNRIAHNWSNTQEAKKYVAFFQSGRRKKAYKGTARCRICGEELGNCDLINDGWIYPEQWEHYISEHSVKPWNAQFVNYMSKR